MDSITQAALGAVVGELVLGKKIGWKASAWGFLFGTLPDLDILALPFLDEVTKLHWHRGISHSIVMMVVVTLLCAKPLAWIHRGRGVTAKEAGWFVFLAWSTHVLIDVFTTYGTQILEPFSDQRFALNNLFIVDLLFTLPLLVCCAVVAIRYVRVLATKVLVTKVEAYAEKILPDERGRFLRGLLVMIEGGRFLGVWMETTVVRSSVAFKALLVSCIYVMFSFVMKLWALSAISDQVAVDFPEAKVVAVAPTPFNTILWRGLIKTNEGYLVKFWSPFDRGETSYDFFPKNEELIEPFEGEEMMASLKWFSRGHWIARRGPEGKVVFIDMRFGAVRDRKNQKQVPMFLWHLSYDDEGDFKASQYRPRGLDMQGALLLIWQRIRGQTTEWEGMKPF